MIYLRKVSSLIMLLLAIPLFNLSCSAPKIEKADIYLVPVGEFSSSLSTELVEHYKKRFNVSVALLPRISLEARAIDNSRRQLIAEELIETIRLKCQDLVNSPKAIVIG